MAKAALGQNEEAQAALQQALTQDIPPLLLLPLRWFEHSHPVLYASYVSPLFSQYDLLMEVAARDEREQAVQNERQKRSQWLAEHSDDRRGKSEI